MRETKPEEIGVGMLGYAFMGKAHANAFRKIGYITWPPPIRPRLVAIAGRNEEAVAEAATRYGFERWTTQWEELVADPEIGLLDIWRRVAATGVKHMCAFNYRFVPAVRLARELIDAGELGAPSHAGRDRVRHRRRAARSDVRGRPPRRRGLRRDRPLERQRKTSNRHVSVHLSLFRDSRSE